jgi:hypothetical protein
VSKTHHRPCPILQIVHHSEKTLGTVDRRLSQAELGNTAVRAVAGTHAFRDYNAFTNIAATNASGNLRGMVVNAKARAVFRYFSEDSKYMESIKNLGLLAGFAAGIAEASNELERMAHSDEPVALKGARLAKIAGTAAQRALFGAVPAGAHAIYKSLEGWCMLAGLAGGKIEVGANQCVATLNRADHLVQSTFKAVTDTTNQARVINNPLDTAAAAARAAKDVWVVIDTFVSSHSSR